ncbi:MAG TPA: hypothetical protein VLT33_41230 [Labilithrix sp.]|nr:hypothetical protein [Labilithrix sp.]
MKRVLPTIVGAALLAILPSCTTPDEGVGSPAAVGGAAPGPADAHCAAKVQSTSPYSCGASTRSARPRSVHPTHEVDAAMTSSYGATMFGSSGADDDCKYDVSWSSTEVARERDVSFTFVVTDRANHAPAARGSSYAEVFLDETHPAPNGGTKTEERSPGQYTIAPIRFDRSGRWTVRLHVFDECADLLADSPHGHAAFYVDVP